MPDSARSGGREADGREAVELRRELAEAYARVFDGPDGEAVFADLMLLGRVELPIFSSDALELAHAEGRRSLALHVRRMRAEGRAGTTAARTGR